MDVTPPPLTCYPTQMFLDPTKNNFLALPHMFFGSPLNIFFSFIANIFGSHSRYSGCDKHFLIPVKTFFRAPCHRCIWIPLNIFFGLITNFAGHILLLLGLVLCFALGLLLGNIFSGIPKKFGGGTSQREAWITSMGQKVRGNRVEH